MTKLEMEFTQALLACLEKAQASTGLTETRLKEQAQKEGGAKALQRLWDRQQLTRQFGLLAQQNKLDLSPEYLATRGRYAPLFTDDQVNFCLEALLEAGAFSI